MDTYDDDPRGSGTSIAAPLIRALLAAAIAFGVYWLIFSPDPADDIVLDDPTETVTTVPTVPADPTTPTTAPTTPVMESTPTEVATTSPSTPGEGVSVQVLNGTDDQAAYDDVVQTLATLGYDVTQSGRARTDYAETTIFATAGQEAAADALQAADARFTTIGENPGNLTATIDIHVVVGEDWAATSDSTEDAEETSTEG